MFFITCLKIISVILAIVGVSFSIPLAVAFYYGESSVYLSFIVPGAISIVLFAVIFLCTRRIKFHLSIKQTFAVVALSWIAASFMGSFPLYFSGCYPEYTNAFFESVSGFTTTGCTVCNDVESLPRSINMWRCLTHWLGGMGIVTLTVALLPLLGVGGFQLIKAETTGPEKGKVTARITTTAKILWLIYAGFTLLETLLLMACGMDFVEALSHGFSTLGTGGFSTRNSSIGAFNSVGIDVVITVFMFIAGVNFSLFFYLITRKFQDIFTNSEFKAYLLIVFVTVLVITFFLLPVYHSFGTSLRYSAFQVMALVTTTGFGTADYILWPAATQFFLFILFFIGGSSGSTSGGVKVIRWVVLGKQLGNETKKMLHPHGVFTIRLNGKPGRDDIVFNVTSFMFLYLILVMITTFFGCLGNLDLTTSFTGALSIVGNVGPAFGNLGPSNNFSMVPEFVKWWYCFAMIAGRLELYTLVIFFVPSFWKNR
jgi:trk system potassium uptake protein TrkH